MSSRNLRRKVSNRLARLANSEVVRGRLPDPTPEFATLDAPGGKLLGEQEYRERLTRNRSPQNVYVLGARMLSPDAVDLLSRIGTAGRMDWEALHDFLHTTKVEILPSAWSVRGVLYAAFLHYVIAPDEASLETAARAVALSVRHREIGNASGEHRLWNMACSVAALRDDRALKAQLDEIRPPDVHGGWAGNTDFALDDARRDDPKSLEAWWRELNKPFTERALEPWLLDTQALASDSSPLFDFIHAPEVEGCSLPEAEQPLVTVIMPTYNPDRSFLNSVESLTRQSWRNLEVLIVDDASPQGTALADEAAASDPRVRVIALTENGGAYRARNAGLAESKGEFITFLDADDLSHSRRIEHQVLPLLEDDRLMATTSRSIRINSDGRATVFATPPMRTNLSSFLFRRERLVDAVGVYETVRKAADTEFRERMEAEFGVESLYRIPVPLSFVQLTTGSLSRSEFRAHSDWIAGHRISYRDQFRGWHRAVRESADRSFLDFEDRPFVAPPQLLGGAPETEIPLAVLGDWTEYEEQASAWAPTIRALAQRTGRPVGLLRGVLPRRSRIPRRNPLSPEIWRLVEEGSAVWLSWAQRTHVETLLATDPELALMLPVADQIDLSIDRLVIAAEPRKHGLPGDGINPEWVASWCARALGDVPVVWAPATDGLRSAISSTGAAVLESGYARLVADRDAATGSESESAATVPHRGRPIIAVAPVGRKSAVPQVCELLPAAHEAAVHLLDDGSPLFEEHDREQFPPQVRVVDEEGLTVSQLLDGADVVVVDALARGKGDPARYLWQALARGAVVVMPRGLAARYGDLVLAFDGSADLQRTLRRLATDAEYRAEQRDRAHRACEASPAVVSITGA